jgi:type IV pilus assembly protein PilV
MQPTRLMKHPGRQTGAGMVEVLIALLISAVGLLGLGGLQASSLRYQKTANFRGLATQYASEMADRLRANLVGVRAGNYSDFASDTYTGNAPTAPASMPCNGSDTASCSPQQVAVQDVYRWRLGLSQGLAGGYGEVSGDADKGFVIRVYYKEVGIKSSTVDPNCRSGATLSPEVRCAVTVFIP